MKPKQLLKKTSDFLTQLPGKFNQLPLEEKIAYGLIVFGVLLIILALILF